MVACKQYYTTVCGFCKVFGAFSENAHISHRSVGVLKTVPIPYNAAKIRRDGWQPMERSIEPMMIYETGIEHYTPGFLPEGMGVTDGAEWMRSRSGLERAMQCRTVLEGTVLLCDNQCTLWVDLGCMRGMMTREEVQLCPDGETVRDIAVITRVGKCVSFVVIGFAYTENGEEVAVLSRREAQRRCRAEFLDRLQAGDVIRAKVTHLEPFGAFVDVGCGIVSMLSIDSISVSRISHPGERFSPGMPIWVVIRSIIPGGRICVSHKELLGTWEENAAAFSPGQTVTGIVRSIESYGVFVELTPNLAGLAEYKENLCVGQRAAVYIKSMIASRMKVKLVFIDTYRGEGVSGGLQYYLPKSCNAAGIPHLDRWQYSPHGAEKCVESIFD